jgi:hypothetical protein
VDEPWSDKSLMQSDNDSSPLSGYRMGRGRGYMKIADSGEIADFPRKNAGKRPMKWRRKAEIHVFELAGEFPMRRYS